MNLTHPYWIVVLIPALCAGLAFLALGRWWWHKGSHAADTPNWDKSARIDWDRVIERINSEHNRP